MSAAANNSRGSAKPRSIPNGGYIVHRRGPGGNIVTPKRRPMFEHDSLEAACDEADRLAELRGGVFAVFEVRYVARAPERPAPVVDKPVATIAAEPIISVEELPAAAPKSARAPVVEVRRRRIKSGAR